MQLHGACGCMAHAPCAMRGHAAPLRRSSHRASAASCMAAGCHAWAACCMQPPCMGCKHLVSPHAAATQHPPTRHPLPPPQARAVKRLLAHRLPHADAATAKVEWYQIVEGHHSLWEGVSEPYKHMIRAFLIHFHMQILSHSTEQFNFANGSIGAPPAGRRRRGVRLGRPGKQLLAVGCATADLLKETRLHLHNACPHDPHPRRQLFLCWRTHLFPVARVRHLPLQPRRTHPRGLYCELVHLQQQPPGLCCMTQLLHESYCQRSQRRLQAASVDVHPALPYNCRCCPPSAQRSASRWVLSWRTAP